MITKVPRLYTILFLIAVLLLFIPPIIDAGNGFWKTKGDCSVVMLIDGDTVKLQCEEGGSKNARILGYDTPEKNAQCITEYVNANRATWPLRWALWTSDIIEVSSNKRDKYGRDLIVLMADGKDVADHMISSGLARAYYGGKRQGWCGP